MLRDCIVCAPPPPYTHTRCLPLPLFLQYPCIVITAKGQPDVATRLFLKKLKSTLNLAVLGLVDSDPYGLKASMWRWLVGGCLALRFTHN